MADTTMTSGDQPAEAHVPFTLEERIKQLCEIDKNIVQLMDHTSSAMSALSNKPQQQTSSSSDAAAVDAAQISPQDQTQLFKSSMDSLLSTLHNVDVHMKRQILGLEEAGIIKLRNDSSATRDGGGGGGGGAGGIGSSSGVGTGGRPVVMNEDAKIVARASLEPNGVGTIGNLDVGWLNSRNNKVERDMEAELWAKMKEFLEKYHVQEGAPVDGLPQ